MKKVDKLKKQRYEISMRIIDLESRKKLQKKSVNLEKELEILRDKEANLTIRIDELNKQ